MEISSAALRTIADWAVDGDSYLPVPLHDSPPGYAHTWGPMDVLATQGDAHIRVDSGGAIKELVAPVVVGRDRTWS